MQRPQRPPETLDLYLTEIIPPTIAEQDAGVDVVSGEYPEGNVRRYGAMGDGTTDDSEAFRTAFSVLGADGGHITVPAGTYLLSGSIDHPLLGSGLYDQGNTGRFTSSIAVLVTGKDNIRVTLEGGAKILWTDTDSNECGALTFYNCDNVTVEGGAFEGTVGGPSLAMALGACEGFTVRSHVLSGRALASIESDTRQGTATNWPKSVFLQGTVKDAAYGAFIFGGEDITVDLSVYNVNRALWVGPVFGLFGKVKGDTISSAAFNFNPRDDAEMNTVHLDVDITNANQGALIRQFANTPTNPTTIKNIKLSGRMSNRASDGQPVVQVSTLFVTTTVVDGIDLSDLRVEYLDRTGSAANAPYAVYISPDVAATIRNIKLGDIICEQAGQSNRAFAIVNNPDATITDVYAIGKRLVAEEEAFFVSAMTAGNMSNFTLSGCQFYRNSSGNAARINLVDDITVTGCYADSATIDLQGCTGVSGDGNRIEGIAPVRSGTIVDGSYVAWTELYEVTSGTPTIDQIEGVPGQVMTVYANGGTPTLNHASTDLNLDSDSNFAMTAGDSVTLICVDGDKWIETGRKT